MKTKIVIAILSIILCQLSAKSSYAQDGKHKKGDDVVQQQQTVTPPAPTYADEAFATEQTVYKSALKYNDYSSAALALQQMLALKPESTNLKDSLDYIYFGSGAYVQCILLGKEIMKTDPAKKGILELVAVSEQNLGAVKESLEDYESLYALSKDPYHLYQIAVLQYTLKRYLECSSSIQTIIADQTLTNDKMVTMTDPSNQRQQVPLKAAAYNMNGVIAMELNKNDVAEQSFNEALKIFPDFTLAKANLDNLKSPKKDDKQSPKKTN